MELLKQSSVDLEYVHDQLYKIGSLPSAYNIFPEIVKLVSDPSKSILHFEAVIKKDPALSSKVLRIINSPYYGLGQKVSKLGQALTLLGVENLYRIVLNLNYYNNYKKIFKNTLFDFNLYWQHFEITAAISQLLAEKFIPEKSAEAHLIGLLHDSGKLILDHFFPREWNQIVLEYKKNNRSILEIEEELIGYNHAILAGELFKIWNFPQEIIIPVKYHHNPLEAPEFEKLTATVFVADQLATILNSNGRVRETTQESKTVDEDWQQIMQLYPKLNNFDINDENEIMDFEEIVRKRIYHRY
jgi:HD-like signal output (HDOD) protein